MSRVIEAISNPARFWVPNSRAGGDDLPPWEPGIYAWWFERSPGAVPVDGVVERDGRRLLYVGIARSSASGNATLRSRICGNHLRGTARTSTLRKTLGCLLADELGLCPVLLPGAKYNFGDGETRLTQWMQQYARVCWVATPEPWEIESELFRKLTLPLNIKENPSNPFGEVLKALRKAMLERAKIA
jgi:hypothetical protein